MQGVHDTFAGMTVHTSDDAERMQRHPVVRVHPETGRKALFVNAQYTIGLDGFAPHEAKLLLDFLFAAVDAHRAARAGGGGQVGDVAFWDNRCVQHMVMADFTGHRRSMHRTTVAGDAPIGAPPSSVPSAGRLGRPQDARRARARRDPAGDERDHEGQDDRSEPDRSDGQCRRDGFCEDADLVGEVRPDQPPAHDAQRHTDRERDDREGGRLPRDGAPYLRGHEAERLEDGEVVATAADRAHEHVRDADRGDDREHAAEQERKVAHVAEVHQRLGGRRRLDEPVVAHAAEAAFELGPPRRGRDPGLNRTATM